MHMRLKMLEEITFDKHVQTSISMPMSLKARIDNAKGMVLRSRYMVYLLESALQREMHVKAIQEKHIKNVQN